MVPVYSVRNRPRACRIGTTWSANTSMPVGSAGGMTLNPSAAPFSNHSWMVSATCSGVPADDAVPAGPRQAVQQAAHGRLLALDDPRDHLQAGHVVVGDVPGRREQLGRHGLVEQVLADLDAREQRPAAAGRTRGR